MVHVGKATAEEIEVEKVRRIVANCNTVALLASMATNLQNAKKPHLAGFIIECEQKANLLRNDVLLPPPLPEDLHPVDLRECWLKASAITGKIGSRTLKMVHRHGYLKSMLRQIQSINKIGTLGFIKLKQHNCLQYSAEVLMRKHFSHELNQQQIERIDVVLEEAGYIL